MVGGYKYWGRQIPRQPICHKAFVFFIHTGNPELLRNDVGAGKRCGRTDASYCFVYVVWKCIGNEFYGTLGVKRSRFKFDTHSLVLSIVKLYLSAVVYLMI